MGFTFLVTHPPRLPSASWGSPVRAGGAKIPRTVASGTVGWEGPDGAPPLSGWLISVTSSSDFAPPGGVPLPLLPSRLPEGKTSQVPSLLPKA